MKLNVMPQIAERAIEPARLPRKLSRDARRRQLVEATIEVLGERGYSRTTLSEVAIKAGLSHGLVNFHFQSKEKLLIETLLFLAEEYRANWTAALASAPDDPQCQLNALLRADFNAAICTPARLFAWCSFWGEAQARPIYQERCGSNDELYIKMLEGICTGLVDQGKYGVDPMQAARVLRVTVEGVWLDMMTMSDPYARNEGLKTVIACASAFFPKHFDANGLIEDRQAFGNVFR